MEFGVFCCAVNVNSESEVALERASFFELFLRVLFRGSYRLDLFPEVFLPSPSVLLLWLSHVTLSVASLS